MKTRKFTKSITITQSIVQITRTYTEELIVTPTIQLRAAFWPFSSTMSKLVLTGWILAYRPIAAVAHKMYIFCLPVFWRAERPQMILRATSKTASALLIAVLAQRKRRRFLTIPLRKTVITSSSLRRQGRAGPALPA